MTVFGLYFCTITVLAFWVQNGVGDPFFFGGCVKKVCFGHIVLVSVWGRSVKERNRGLLCTALTGNILPFWTLMSISNGDHISGRNGVALFWRESSDDALRYTSYPFGTRARRYIQ